MRSRASYLAIAFLVSLGISSTSAYAQAAIPIGGTTTTGASCQITSLSATKGTTSTSATMFYSCSGRFSNSNVSASIQFQQYYNDPLHLATGIYGTKNASLAVSVVNPGRALCTKDTASLLNFCDSSPTTTTVPDVLKCLKDLRSGKFYCPSWQTVGATTATGTTAGTSLASQTSLLPVGAPSPFPGTGTAILPAGSVSTSAARTDCWTAVASITWYDELGNRKAQTVAKKPTGCL